jgi:hypothetical protein
MKTRKEILSEIKNADDHYGTARNYLMTVVNIWTPDQLNDATNRLVSESCGCCNNPLSNNLFA